MVETGDVRDPDTIGVMTGQGRHADVVILTALREEYDAVLQVAAGAVPNSAWERTTSADNLPLAFREFKVPVGRPLRVAAAVAADMGATAAIYALLPLVEVLRPSCITMCGVCAGRPEKTQLGDVVAADRVFYHDTGKQRRGRVQQDLKTYNLRDDWKNFLDGMSREVVARFRKEKWFKSRPLTTEARLHRALVALRDGVAKPWKVIDRVPEAEDEWPLIVAALRERRLLAASSHSLTNAGRRFVEDFLFRHRGTMPDLSTTGRLQPFQLHVAPIGSGTRVIEDERIWGYVSKAMRKTLSLEMEAAVIGEFAHRQRRYKLDWVVMKGVMDFANHGRDDHFKAFAARASAECLIAFLRDHVPTEAIPDVDDLLTTGTVPAPQHAPPSSLLVARHTVVPWHDRGREQTLAELDAWADDAGHELAVRLLHAPGGTGKTRLAIEWVRRRRERGDVAGFLGLKPSEHWLRGLCERGARVVIVVDYAESRADRGELLDRIAQYADAPGPRRRVHMLLLARGDGDWWTELRKRSDAIDALLRNAAPIALPPLATTAPDRDAVFAEAATRFAAVLGKPATSRPPIALEDPRFERALYLHMAALAAVEGVAFEAGTLMDAILNHEERFWTKAATYAVNAPLARQFIAAATLRGGIAREDDAQDLYSRLAQRPRNTDDDAMLAVLHDVYRRAGESRYLPGLEPDLLGEAMAVRVAAARQGDDASASDDWIDRVFVTGDDEQAVTTAFAVLGRASATDGAPVHGWIASLLKTDLATRAVLALRAAKIVGQRTAFSVLGDILAEAVEQRGSAALASTLNQEGIPYPTVLLQRVASWRSLLLLDSSSTSADETSMTERALWLGQHGIDLAAAGQREAALAVTREAVELYRALAARNPDAFQPELAGGLNNLSVDLSNLGQREAALAAAREAVELYRALAARNPDAFQPALAGGSNNLGNRLSKLGQREAALAVTREAVELHRALAARNPDAFQSALADGLNNLGNRLSALGQREAALAATHEAVELYRALAARNPDAFQPALARGLNNLSVDLSNLEAALAAAREAVELYRALAARNLDAFQPDLAGGLNSLGNRLSNLGQYEAALAAAREAVELYRALAARNPDAFQPNLATSLNNLGNRLSNLGQHGAALEAIREAVALYRALAARNPDAFQPALADGVNNLGVMLSNLGQHEAALEATREAEQLRSTARSAGSSADNAVAPGGAPPG